MLKEMLFNQAMLGNGGSNIAVVPFTAKKNGTYRTPSNIAFSPVTVEVPTPQLTTLTATENKTYYADYNQAYDTVTVNVPKYTLIWSSEYEVNCSSETEIDVSTITYGYTSVSNNIVYVKVRRKGFIPQNCFAGSDAWLTFPSTAISYTNNNGYVCYARMNGGGRLHNGITAGKPYGIYPTSVGTTTAVIKARYNGDISLTIDGTYIVEGYLIQFPNNDYPFKS